MSRQRSDEKSSFFRLGAHMEMGSPPARLSVGRLVGVCVCLSIFHLCMIPVFYPSIRRNHVGGRTLLAVVIVVALVAVTQNTFGITVVVTAVQREPREKRLDETSGKSRFRRDNDGSTMAEMDRCSPHLIDPLLFETWNGKPPPARLQRHTLLQFYQQWVKPESKRRTLIESERKERYSFAFVLLAFPSWHLPPFKAQRRCYVI